MCSAASGHADPTLVACVLGGRRPRACGDRGGVSPCRGAAPGSWVEGRQL